MNLLLRVLVPVIADLVGPYLLAFGVWLKEHGVDPAHVQPLLDFLSGSIPSTLIAIGGAVYCVVHSEWLRSKIVGWIRARFPGFGGTTQNTGLVALLCLVLSGCGIGKALSSAGSTVEKAATTVAALPASSFVAQAAGDYAAGRILANVQSPDGGTAKIGSLVTGALYKLTSASGSVDLSDASIAAAKAAGKAGLNASQATLYDALFDATASALKAWLTQYPNSAALAADFLYGMEVRFNAGS